jgi:hypothetical protein
MRSVTRRSLSASMMAVLSTLSSQVTNAADPKGHAATLWKTKPKEAFSEVRMALKTMAGGRERCLYCEDNEGTDIEHFWPKSKYPEKAFGCGSFRTAASPTISIT